MIGFAYAFITGLLSSFNILFSKMMGELLQATFASENSQFKEALTYVYIGVFVGCNALQVRGRVGCWQNGVLVREGDGEGLSDRGNGCCFLRRLVVGSKGGVWMPPPPPLVPPRSPDSHSPPWPVILTPPFSSAPLPILVLADQIPAKVAGAI